MPGRITALRADEHLKMNANKITLFNSFHNTSVVVRSPAETAQEAWFEIQESVYGQSAPTTAAKAKLRRVEKALCGCSGCTCGIVR